MGKRYKWFLADRKEFQERELEENRKVKLYDVTSYPEQFIDDIYILRGEMRKFNINTNDKDMIMTYTDLYY